jgi:hypothetical protein
MYDYSMFLFARPSFAEGVGRILDLGNTLSEYNSSLTPDQADTLARKADWQALRKDALHVFRHKGYNSETNSVSIDEE